MGVIMHNNIPYGGGSTIEPNPQESATDQLETLGIDGDVYEVTDANAIHTSDVGVANGIAELDSNGKVPKAELPSDVVYDNPTFTEASTRANIASGETIATILGKIKKWFSDLKTVAFTGAYSDLSGTPTIPTVNNGTLTIKQNNNNLGTFTANQSTASNINIECALPSDVEGSKVATGNPLTITDAAGIKAEKIVIEFEPKQAGSGTPSPSNIRPITGYTSISANGCGKNLINPAKITESANHVNGYVYSDGDGLLVDAGQYTLSVSQQCNGLYVSEAVEGASSIAYVNNSDVLTFTIPNKMYIKMQSWRNSGVTGMTYQLERGNQATTYEPFKGDNVTVQFGQTIYGGKLTILQDGSAEIECDRGITTKTWSDGTEATQLTNNIRKKFGTLSDASPNNGEISDKLPMIVNWSQDSSHFYIDPTSKTLVVFMPTNTITSTEFTICYKLATPFTLHLSPVETLNLLQGINNVWTDGTTLSLTYQPDNAIGQAKGTAQEAMMSTIWTSIGVFSQGDTPVIPQCKELLLISISQDETEYYDGQVYPYALYGLKYLYARPLNTSYVCVLKPDGAVIAGGTYKLAIFYR